MRRKRFDWRAIHGELEGRLSRVGTTIDDDPVRAQELLRQRSLALAAAKQEQSPARQLERMLVFRLGQERYALSLECAREITDLARVALLPGARTTVRGLINWREEFVVVFDAASVLGLPRSDATRPRVIVLRGDELRLALAVDAVDDIVEIDPAALQPPEQLQCRHANLIRGATVDAVLVLGERPLLAWLGGELQAA